VVTTVIGVDPSLSSTGLVTWRDGRIFVATVVTAPGLPAPMRHDMIVMRILGMVDPAGPSHTLVVIEGRITPADDAVQTAMDLAELRGVINYGLHVRNVNRVDVHPATLKVFATGNGHASKANMTLAARGRLGEHLHCANDDESDAAWLMSMAMHQYGRPLCRLPQKHLAALTRPKWPPFKLEATS
jgi:Holliday junction resolvasome RuvABC endonuclease subunit